VCLLRRPLEPVKSRAARIAAIIPVLDEEGAIGPVLAAMPRDWVDQVIVVDGGSRDGTIAEARAGGATALVERERGYGRACAKGAAAAIADGAEILVFLDGDGGDRPEAIPSLLAALARPDVDFVLASRYVAGGSTHPGWGIVPRLNSWIARWLALPFIAASDPMSGFFALRRPTFLGARELDPVGYKIALELIVKCGCRAVQEVPIHFAPRLHGRSKLGLRVRIDYLRHLKRLIDYRYGGLLGLIGATATGAPRAATNRP